MSDDWNLKDKKVTTWATNNVNDTWYTYKDTDIETLRKKLIDDFKEIAQGESPDNVVWVETLLCNIIDMINERFGIDES